MAQCGKVHARKSKDLSSSPRAHIMLEETTSTRLSLELHMPPTMIIVINKIKHKLYSSKFFLEIRELCKLTRKINP